MPRLSVRRIAAFWVIAGAAVVLLVEFAPSVREATRMSSENAELSALDRDLAGARAVDISGDFLLWADAAVAPNETFLVEIGPNVRVSTPVTLEAVRGFTQYLLQPRRLATDGEPDWLLCYGCELDDWPSFEEIWADGQGITVGRVGR